MVSDYIHASSVRRDLFFQTAHDLPVIVTLIIHHGAVFGRANFYRPMTKSPCGKSAGICRCALHENECRLIGQRHRNPTASDEMHPIGRGKVRCDCRYFVHSSIEDLLHQIGGIQECLLEGLRVPGDTATGK
ncbi:hypothetical protein SDC9_196318 [bioreactor metagenome]|uniref:Uncharacterized protein n=1 Tax=bioreactor metagenome TaxID=1076179 RepID=A0A645ICS6_9ZZZZ